MDSQKKRPPRQSRAGEAMLWATMIFGGIFLALAFYFNYMWKVLPPSTNQMELFIYTMMFVLVGIPALIVGYVITMSGIAVTNRAEKSEEKTPPTSSRTHYF